MRKRGADETKLNHSVSQAYSDTPDGPPPPPAHAKHRTERNSCWSLTMRPSIVWQRLAELPHRALWRLLTLLTFLTTPRRDQETYQADARGRSIRGWLTASMRGTRPTIAGKFPRPWLVQQIFRVSSRTLRARSPAAIRSLRIFRYLRFRPWLVSLQCHRVQSCRVDQATWRPTSSASSSLGPFPRTS